MILETSSDLFGRRRLPEVSYIICTTPRSGGRYLAATLEQTQLAGQPRDNFRFWWQFAEAANADADSEQEAWRLPPAEYMKKIFEFGTGANGVFGVIMTPQQLEIAVKQLKTFVPAPQSPAAEILAAVFPNLHYIHLSRRDKIRQVVSLVKALQSQQWFELEAEALGALVGKLTPAQFNQLAAKMNTAPANNLQYNIYAMTLRQDQLAEEDAAWEAFFKKSEIQPCRVIYEDLVASYEPTVFAILDYLKISRPKNFPISRPPLKKQSDAINEEWVQRYTADLAKPALPYFGLHKMPEISYLICTTPRSGSTYLARTLENTGIAGRPRENFRFWAFFAHELQPDHDPEWKEWVLPPVDYMRKLFLVGTSANHVFGVKIMWTHLKVIVSQLKAFMPSGHQLLNFKGMSEPPQFAKAKTETKDAEIIAEFLPNLHYLYLTRRDKIHQAVSLVKARQSNKWHDEGTAIDDRNRMFTPGNEPGTMSLLSEQVMAGASNHGGDNLRFDFDQIFKEHQELLSADSAWEAYFREAGIQPYRVFYEDFVQSYEPTILGILDYLKISPPKGLTLHQPSLKKQSDATNAEWARRYTAELAQSTGEFSRAPLS